MPKPKDVLSELREAAHWAKRVFPPRDGFIRLVVEEDRIWIEGRHKGRDYAEMLLWEEFLLARINVLLAKVKVVAMFLQRHAD